MIDDSGPAFPNDGHDNGPGNIRGRPALGMTLRDYFAAKAMEAIICTAAEPCIFGFGGTESTVAKYAYGMAIAMLAERAK